MRTSKLARKTKETAIAVRLALDGDGTSTVKLPDRWVAHMIESLVRFARFDLDLAAEGDLDHHRIEDVAITLGRAFREAIGDRRIERIGTAHVAMDDALVMVSVDLVDRPFVDVALPDEMLEHFLRSFAHEARITLHNVVLKGKNPHHINEATFKALGLALRDAVRPTGALVSTKGDARLRRK